MTLALPRRPLTPRFELTRHGLIMLGLTCALLVGAIAGFNLTLLKVVVGLPIAAVAVICAWRYPGVLFAAYILIPYYKGGIQPFLPADITPGLALLNIGQAGL